jgi:hypothetical protein
VCRLQDPTVTGAYNQCFQQVQEDMSKTHSVCKDWDFVSWGTEISICKFLIEYFTPLTLGEQHQGDLSDEDVTEVWLEAKSESSIKVRRTKDGVKACCPLTVPVLVSVSPKLFLYSETYNCLLWIETVEINRRLI